MTGIVHQPPARRWRGCVALFMAVGLLNCPAASATLTSVADTMISENYPDNNFGALWFANSGTTQNNTLNRALFRFDLAAVLPAGAIIKRASLILEVVGQPNEPPASGRFNLHRVLRPWGEGSAVNTPGGGAGQGSPGTTNEATWNYRFAYTTNTWSLPGAAPPADFMAELSSGVTVFGVDQSPYTVPSSPQLIADLQLWLDQPQSNFGWILVCEQEGSAFTARRFGTHEDPFNAPRLEVEYEIVPRIDSVQTIGNEFALSFVAQPGLIYTVEYCDTLVSNSWHPLAYAWTPNDPKRFQVADPIASPQRFYRLVTAP